MHRTRRGVVGIALASIIVLVAAVLSPASAGVNESETFGPGAHTFEVPDGVTSLTVDAHGAQGGPGSGSAPSVGGLGGRVLATIDVEPGQVVAMDVGWYAGQASDDENQGGDRTLVQLDGVPVLISGGGGGAGQGALDGRSGYSGIETQGGDGGPGGGTAPGTTGETAPPQCLGGGGGGAGATGGDGGTGGTGDNTGSDGNPGTADGEGGRPMFNGFWSTIAGDGGDGAFGGGAGGNGGMPFGSTIVCGAGGGGGGSSNGPTDATYEAGMRAGDGQVVLSWVGPDEPDSDTPDPDNQSSDGTGVAPGSAASADPVAATPTFTG